ncbi:hypothetical protein HYH02_003962 [Chlamydomonas schloesseri]|uniref:Uncharacterized protein n=1 Tax=Chlamydomonas schloesseri TaxID=2026947 RepID=A0A836B9A1_9CHLO|nr:hypothetical protein HYH02_003962 [Chlamydomonas schloesseri]|eukprot:KAG2451358.1 hypothetical protein HYH02_003962 [Chlamydomonas schloesseri]
MATRGRNFLRNPAFRREANTQLLELGRSSLWGSKWTRNAWVENDALQNNVAWEARAEGLVSAGGAGEGAPPPPLPYAGGGIRLGERMQQGLAGLRAGLLSGLGAAAGLGVVGLGASTSGGSSATASSGAATELDAAGAQAPASSAASAGLARQGMPALQEQDSEEAGGMVTSSSLSSTSAAAAVSAAVAADGAQERMSAAPAAGPETGLAAAARASEAREPPSCIATTSDWCEVMQVVDLQWELQRRGLSAAQAAHLLDAGLGLRLAVHVGSRANTLGQFCVGLMLDEGAAPGGSGDNVADQMQHFVPRPNRHSYFSGRVRCNGSDRWQRFEYNVTCPRGFRRALVLLRGRRAHDPNAPALPPPVYCGAKFAAAELLFE